jgi:catechol 2,3-dioxygenase-like lactoylglutathione lyase family enzyme
MSAIGLDHVQVAAPVGGEATARAFYGGVLGLVEIEQPAVLAGRGGVWFALGPVELHIGSDPRFAPAAKAHPGIAVRDEQALRDLARRLEAAGHPVAWADPTEIPGRVRFHVADPFGNRLELLART